MIAQLYDCFKHWAANGTVWIISDPHFRDKELRAGIPGRPTGSRKSIPAGSPAPAPPWSPGSSGTGGSAAWAGSMSRRR